MREQKSGKLRVKSLYKKNHSILYLLLEHLWGVFLGCQILVKRFFTQTIPGRKRNWIINICVTLKIRVLLFARRFFLRAEVVNRSPWVAEIQLKMIIFSCSQMPRSDTEKVN